MSLADCRIRWDAGSCASGSVAYDSCPRMGLNQFYDGTIAGALEG